ncbi:MAG: excinuclease ABC subunit UvrA [Bacteroidetes bacterium]|nr:excinuclease ABC subunit UvrA [Bacteroidota bacterium]
MAEQKIKIFGAREHNLKNIDVELPRNSLTVITGLSGSGKSSLAFDTIYAEGQRRFMETLSSYARQFIGGMERPNIDKIEGLSPVVAIEQKTTNKNPRSTVGTVTEINDFLRLLFARASTAYSSETGEEMVRLSDDQILSLITQKYDGKKIAIMAPIIRGRKGNYRELLESFIKKGFIYVNLDGEIQEMQYGMSLDRYKNHYIDLVVDRLVVEDLDVSRLKKSVEQAMGYGKNTISIFDYESNTSRFYSRNLMCPTTGIAYDEPAPFSFSFNSPRGACPACNGLGERAVFDISKIIPKNNLSINDGAILSLGKRKKNINFVLLDALSKRHEFSLDDPISELDSDIIDIIMKGDSNALKIESKDMGVIGGTHLIMWKGIVAEIENSIDDESTKRGDKWKSQFVKKEICDVCHGTRLNQQTNYFRIDGKNMGDVSKMSISALKDWIEGIDENLSKKNKRIAHEIIGEISQRASFLIDVGLDYLSLSRCSATLSGGESQRIRLATQIGSKLVNVTYILDEPSIGLHQKDNEKLIKSLKHLRDIGNTVIVVEHDEEIMRQADWIIDIGHGAGKNGGEVVLSGTFDDLIKSKSITADYLSGRKIIEKNNSPREGNGKEIKLFGAKGNNLKSIDVAFPLGKFICITGVSGSGKSTLINSTLRPLISRNIYRTFDTPLEYESIEGVDNVDKIVTVDQSAIGKSPRSNPATYTSVMTDIRNLFEQTHDSKIRGFKAGRFSFNVKGGRCEECSGAGVKTIEMNFLPDVYVKCPVCNGRRYNAETLKVRFKGKNIYDILEMTINEAQSFFESIPNINIKLSALIDVGLGYITLGQPSTTLSGGECQRIKLASELSKRDTGNTLFILDEPTTGLHFYDISILLKSLNKLVERGNTVIVIEHNLEVINAADWIIDIGKDGGEKGGNLIYEGTREGIIGKKNSYTAKYITKD